MADFRTTLRNRICTSVVTTGIVPTTTIADVSGISAGATSFTAASSADAALFIPGGVASFWDGTTELPVMIASVNAAVVTLDFTGRFAQDGTPITGLVNPHAHGSTVATNIVPVQPNMREQGLAQVMFGNRWPVIRVFVLDSVTKWGELAATAPTAMVHLIYQLPLDQPTQSRLQGDLWMLQQVNRTELDIAKIIDPMRADPTLGGLALLVVQWIQAARESATAAGLPIYEQYLDIHVQGDDTGMELATH